MIEVDFNWKDAVWRVQVGRENKVVEARDSQTNIALPEAIRERVIREDLVGFQAAILSAIGRLGHKPGDDDGRDD